MASTEATADRARQRHDGGVLVLDSGTRGGLAAVRELARSGWRVGLGTPHDGTYADRSRAVAARHRVRLPGPVDVLAADVTAAIEAGRYDAVLGAGDDWLVALPAAAADIPAVVAHPEADAVLTAVDKLALGERCGAVGLATPATWPAAGAPPLPAGATYVVKARAHGPVDEAGARPQTHLVSSPDGLAAAIAELQGGGHEPVVQELVRGRLMALSGVLLDGRLVGRVQQVAEETWPLGTGVSCRARTVAVDEHLASMVESLLVDIGWTGMVEAQFLDPGRGRPRLIDLNGRPYGSLALAGAAGVPLVDTTVRAALGMPLEIPADGEIGARYQWCEGDLRRAWAQGPEGRARDVLRTAGVALRSTHSVWDWRDPAPCVRTRLLDPLRRRVTGTAT